MKTPDSTKAEPSAPNKRNFTAPIHFTGTENPRHLRVIFVLLRRPISREQLDSAAGASNGPELVANLRRLGLELPCERITFLDRDGKPCHPGVYSLTLSDRRKVYKWIAKRDKGQANG